MTRWPHRLLTTRAPSSPRRASVRPDGREASAGRLLAVGGQGAVASLSPGAPRPTEAAVRPPDDSASLLGRLVRRSALAPACRERMFALLSAHFDGVGRKTFLADLAGKDFVILLENREGVLQGFSTLHVYESRATSPPVTVIYSGDTIVHRDAWGSPALARTWVHAVGELTRGRTPGAEVYWLLLTSGYRTYRFLPVFYRRFHPKYDEPTPPAIQRLMEAVAFERFGEAYDPAGGIVRFPRPQVLKSELLDVPDGRRRDPHVAFFLGANPGFVRGDELVCLTRIDDDNLTPAARRMMRNRS